MPPLPKRKISSRRSGKRRQNHRVKLPNMVKCKFCNTLKLSHQIC